jgi:OOP family OmpA-OmpF porin
MLRLSIILFLATLKSAAQLNSIYYEQAPVLTPDGMELYFTIGNHPMNVGGKSDMGDIWVSRWVDNQWTTPTLAKGSINNDAYNAVLGFSTDGQKMFLYGHYNYYGEAAGSQGISVSKRVGGIWTNPRNETIPSFQNNSVVPGGHLTANKTVFVFSVDVGSNTHEDIYVSFHVDEKWTEPKNLGPTINTKSQELTPWLSADTKTLYFANNTEASLGRFDIFSSERLDSTWTNWSPPKNLGTAINSAESELFYSSRAGKILYTSTFNSNGFGDIREAEVPKPIVPEPKKDSIPEKPTIVPEVVPVEIPDNGRIKIVGMITNAKTGALVPASIVFYRPQPPVVFVLASKKEGYNAELLPKSVYSVQIESPGYTEYSGKIDLTNQQLRQLEINFKLEPLPVGTSVSLRNILFRQSTAEMLPESNDELNMVVDFMLSNPTVEIELSGHTDDAGNAKLNLKLSRDRVARIKHYITEKGIEAARIQGVGYGERKPIASNDTEAGRKQNRRVEFKIVKE